LGVQDRRTGTAPKRKAESMVVYLCTNKESDV
jgi:hypothetical protein